MDGLAQGLLAYVAATAGAALLFGAVLYSGAIAGGVRRLSRRLHLLPPTEPPQSEPIEQLAADVRRLARDVRRFPPGFPMTRRRATIAAYDDALLDACRALDVTTSLAGLPDGVDRDVERLRVEDRLRHAGLVMDDAA